MYDALMVAWTMSDRVSLGMIGRICLKSLLKNITFPPKIGLHFVWSFIMSFGVLSKTSKQNLCPIGASSHIIRWACFNSCAALEPYLMPQIEFSSLGIGILKEMLCHLMQLLVQFSRVIVCCSTWMFFLFPHSRTKRTFLICCLSIPCWSFQISSSVHLYNYSD